MVAAVRTVPLALVVALLACVGCASTKMQGSDCTTEKAYARGFNDGKYGSRRHDAVTELCADEVQVAYRRGYLEGDQRRTEPLVAPAPYGCIESPDRRRTCGYDCKLSAGRVACGATLGDNCIEAFGELRCGDHCRPSFGKIVCIGD